MAEQLHFLEFSTPWYCGILRQDTRYRFLHARENAALMRFHHGGTQRTEWNRRRSWRRKSGRRRGEREKLETKRSVTVSTFSSRCSIDGPCGGQKYISLPRGIDLRYRLPDARSLKRRWRGRLRGIVSSDEDGREVAFFPRKTSIKLLGWTRGTAEWMVWRANIN